MNKDIRAYSVLTVKEVSEDKRIIRGMATTPETDRVDDIVEPEGIQYKNPSPLLWMHNHELPVGEVRFGKATKDGLPFEAKIANVPGPSQLKARLDEAWESVKAGLIRAVSIGFRPLEWNLIESTGGYRFTKLDLYELSLVTVPANAGATIEAIKSYDASALAAFGKKSTEDKSDKTPPSVLGKVKTVKLTPKEGDNTMNIEERIVAFKGERAAKVQKMEDIMSGSENESLAPEAAEEYDTLAAEIKEIDKHLERLNTLQKAQVSTAKPVTEDAGKTAKSAVAARSVPAQPIRVKKQEEKGIAFARVAKCLGLARGSWYEAAMRAEKLYPDDQRIANILKTAVAGATTSDSTWAGPLVGDETTVYADFIEYLRPMTILGKFGTNGIPSLRNVPFRTALVGQTSGGDGYWVGEGKAKPLTALDFSRTTLDPLKVANIAVVTDEVLRSSSPAAEGIIRDSLAQALVARLDTDFIAPTKAAVSGVSPASITYGLTATTSSGTTAADVRDDIKAVFGEFIAANNTPTNGVWIMPATTALALSLMTTDLDQPEFAGISMIGGTFQGLPVIVSEYVPSDSSGAYVALVNASDIYLGDEGGVMIDMSREASLEMSDAPTGDATAGTGASLVSMFQTNSVAFRAERIINWKKRRTSAVALLDGVNWGDSV